MTIDGPRLAMVAGEASGDLLAELLLGGVRARWPAVRTMGIGGPRMQSLGFESWWPQEKLAVRGYFEVLAHLRELLSIRAALGRRLLDERPDAFIGIDAPDFNLGLETRLKAAGVKTIHFVSPSIWAWRGGRIDRIGQAVDHMLCLFPFEPEIYAAKGIAATYVGHPLADAIPLEPPRAEARRRLGLADAAPVVALLPGSRGSEIQHNAPAFARAAARMALARKDLRFVLPVAPGRRPAIDAALAAAGVEFVQVIEGQSHDALAACDVTLIASGTATLEAALFKRPMVIAYRMNALSWQVLKRMNYQPWIGLPNILLRDFAVPELLQSQATPEALADQTLAWLDAPARVAALARRFEELHLLLRRNTAKVATDAIAQILDA